MPNIITGMKTKYGVNTFTYENNVWKYIDYSNSSASSETISSIVGGSSVTSAVLNVAIPTDENDNNLHITIQLSQSPSFTSYIQLSSEYDYQRMLVAQDSDFSGIDSDGIYPSFYGGILIVLLDSGIEGFDPNIAWYVRVRWSNGQVTNPWRLTRFIHTGNINETD